LAGFPPGVGAPRACTQRPTDRLRGRHPARLGNGPRVLCVDGTCGKVWPGTHLLRLFARAGRSPTTAKKLAEIKLKISHRDAGPRVGYRRNAKSISNSTARGRAKVHGRTGYPLWLVQAVTRSDRPEDFYIVRMAFGTSPACEHDVWVLGCPEYEVLYRERRLVPSK
jgi:hypothetical protein